MPPTAKDKLETRSLSGVEILAVGTWNGDDYTDADLDDMVANFAPLSGKIDPVAKLGHDGNQQLAQKDGFPAIGWVTRVYRAGTKLLADFKDIPAKVADLIAAHAYDKVSSEVYFDLDLDGTTYHRVLKAVAFLGAEMPAVKDIKSISDVAALYTKLAADGIEPRVAEYTEVKKLDWGDDLPATTIGAAIEARLHESFTSFADGLRRYSVVTQDERIALSSAIGPAIQTFIASAPADVLARPINGSVAAGYYTAKKPEPTSEGEHDMDIKELAAIVGLPETATEAEVKAKLEEMKKTPAPVSALSEGEARELRDSVGTLTKELAERKATEAVEGALKAGKLTPAQTEWAKEYALKDPDGFKAYAEKTPKLAILGGPLGGDSNVDDEPKEPTAMESTLAAQLGISGTALAERKADTRSLTERAREMREKAGVA